MSGCKAALQTKRRKTVAEEIEDFTEIWGAEEMISFFEDTYALVKLYDVTEEFDWLRDSVGAEDVLNSRIIQTTYLMSRIAELHAGKLCTIKMKHRHLHKRIEELSDGSDEE